MIVVGARAVKSGTVLERVGDYSARFWTAEGSFDVPKGAIVLVLEVRRGIFGVTMAGMVGGSRVASGWFASELDEKVDLRGHYRIVR